MPFISSIGYFVIIAITISSTISDNPYNQDEYPPRQYYPQSELQQDSKFDPRLQQMLDGSRWRNKPVVPFKQDNINVKAELDKLNSTYIVSSNWPKLPRNLSYSAVCFDLSGHIVVFQRGNHVWNQETFNYDNVYRATKEPIAENTIITIHKITGNIISEWGKNIFFMPHGITVDHKGNTWVTDVALHQIIKFGPEKIETKPDLVLGQAFLPGKGPNKFCKPTSVAVLPNGDFFVADGYCNARIVKYSKSGSLLSEWGQHTFQGKPYDVAPENFFAVPHSLTLANDKGLLCVADRENGRVQCFFSQNGTFHSQYHSPIVGDRLFAVSYAPINGGQLYVVNGPIIPDTSKPDQYSEVLGFVINMETKKVVSKFEPSKEHFQTPHDLIVSPDGTEIYVVEILPTSIYKFLSTDMKTYEHSSVGVKPTATLDDPTLLSHSSITIAKVEPSITTTLLVVLLVIVFSLLTMAIALLISRRRKRGCLPLAKSTTRNRRHAWDFPTVKSDSFKLGNLLDRKRGFEKLNQDASDEEPTAATNMLT